MRVNGSTTPRFDALGSFEDDDGVAVDQRVAPVRVQIEGRALHHL